jgi:hypothetical protein
MDDVLDTTSLLKKIETIFLAASIVLTGMFLPIITGSVYPPDGMVNLIWGSLLGVGFGTELLIFGHAPAGLFGLLWGFVGFIVWPAVVVSIFVRTWKFVQNHKSGFVSGMIRALVVASFFWCLPITKIQPSGLHVLPIFTKYIDYAPR